MGVSLILQLEGSGVQTSTGLWPVRKQATQQSEQKASSGSPHSLHYCLNTCPLVLLTLPTEPSSSPPPTPVCEEVVLHETGPWCQKCWETTGPQVKGKDQKAHKFNSGRPFLHGGAMESVKVIAYSY